MASSPNVYSFQHAITVNAGSSSMYECFLRSNLRRMQINSITFHDFAWNLHTDNMYQLPDNASCNAAYLIVGSTGKKISREFFDHMIGGVLPIAAPSGNGDYFHLGVGQYIFNSFFVEDSLYFRMNLYNNDIDSQYQHEITLIVEVTENVL